MSYWASWAVALGLVSVAVGHWVLTSRMMAVSGAFTAIVNRLRHGKTEETTWSEAQLLEALQAATAAEFELSVEGESAELSESAVIPRSRAPAPHSVPSVEAGAPALPLDLPRPPRSVLQHTVFLFALIIGGAISAFLQGGYELGFELQSPAFQSAFGGTSSWGIAALLVGGVLVGAGTRMAGGCTSGHGLCGVSRLQPGSLIATVVFFGTGILTVLLMGRIT